MERDVSDRELLENRLSFSWRELQADVADCVVDNNANQEEEEEEEDSHHNITTKPVTQLSGAIA